MPVQPCQEEGAPGYKWGESGKCYTYTSGDESSRSRAEASAERQGRAARAGGYQGMRKQEDWAGKPLYDELPEDEKAFADAILSIAETFGPLDREDGNIWVGYESSEDNEDSEIGVKCENCALLASKNRCAILSQEIELGGICRLSVIPPGKVGGVERSWKGTFLPML